MKRPRDDGAMERDGRLTPRYELPERPVGARQTSARSLLRMTSSVES
jgi:hypothetical protein